MILPQGECTTAYIATKLWKNQVRTGSCRSTYTQSRDIHRRRPPKASKDIPRPRGHHNLSSYVVHRHIVCIIRHTYHTNRHNARQAYRGNTSQRFQGAFEGGKSVHRVQGRVTAVERRGPKVIKGREHGNLDKKGNKATKEHHRRDTSQTINHTSKQSRGQGAYRDTTGNTGRQV